MVQYLTHKGEYMDHTLQDMFCSTSKRDQNKT